MKYTIEGRLGRAQLIVIDMTGPGVPEHKRQERPEFRVRLLSKRANRNTSYAAAGDEAYRGSDFDRALLQIKAWTGLEEFPLPSGLRKYARQETGVME
jgi:hypothetical protein